MKIIKEKIKMQEIVFKWRASGFRIGFVPTMGYLHEGHVSLIEKAAEENDKVIVSIFINPMQFDKKDDLDNYPKDMVSDINSVILGGGDLIYTPSNSIFPENFSSLVEVKNLDSELCGRTRPRHFKGVCTIVNKLFNIVQPNKAYFGEKDYQQLAIIKKMVMDLDIPVEIVGCPIKRENSGLAMSSRNTRLTKKQKKEASKINPILTELKENILKNKNLINIYTSEAREKINSIPEAKLDYLEVADSRTLKKLTSIDKDFLIATAVFMGAVRLIDNIIYKEGEE